MNITTPQLSSPASLTRAYAGQILGPGVHRFYVTVTNAATVVTIKLRYDSTYDTTLSRPQVVILQNGDIGVAGQTVTATTSALNAWETETFSSFTPTAGGEVILEVRSFDYNGGGHVYFDTESN